MNATRVGLLLACMLSVTVSRSAAADGTEGVVAIGGNAEQRDMTTINTAVTGVLHSADWQLSPKPLAKKEVDGLLRCLDATDDKCIPDTVNARGVRRAYVLTAQKAQSTDGTLAVVLTGKVIAMEPAAFVVRQRRCEPCTDDSLQRASSGLTQELLDELSVRLGRTLITIETNPQGANVHLDGQGIGATNMTAKTFPGTHTVQIEKTGFITVNRTVQAEDGKTAQISVDLRRSDAKPPIPDTHTVETKDSGSWWLPGAGLVAGGALATAGGIALVYLGQQDGPNDRYRYTHATLLGVGTIAVGIAAGAYGGYLLWRGPPESGPTVAATRGGAILGWAGSF